MPQAKTEVALQFSECCAAETALQHWLFCSAEVIWTKSCVAANEKLHCNIEKAALQESGAFLPLSCGFQAPTFRHPRLGPAETYASMVSRDLLAECPGECPQKPAQGSGASKKVSLTKVKGETGSGATRLFSLRPLQKLVGEFFFNFLEGKFRGKFGGNFAGFFWTH